MKCIIFGDVNLEMKAVLSNIPYSIDYIVTNREGVDEFEGIKVYTSSKLYDEEYDNIFILISDADNYAELAEQLVKMGFIEGKHFAGALEYLFNQWENIENFNDIFIVRIRQMSFYISSNSQSVLDLGCGNQHLKKFLNKDIIYMGVDYTDRGDGTIICDFNKGEFPSEKADTVFCSGCLEYIDDVERFIDNICKSANREIIISYCPLEYKRDIFERRKYGWKNHLTIRQLINTFKIMGYECELSAKSIGVNFILKLKNRRRYIIDLVKKKNLTYLEREALEELMEAVVRTEDLKGCIIETGCALGGSGICIAHEKMIETKLFIYDIFGMIPAPGEKDGQDVVKRYEVIKEGKSQGIGGDLYYGYQENLQAIVENNFCNLLKIDSLKEKNVFLIKGLFEDSLYCEEPVALAHIDCDWYDSVMICLERIVPNLVRGGVMVIDDYYHWSGARNAIDEYFKDKKELYIFEKKNRLHIIKK